VFARYYICVGRLLLAIVVVLAAGVTPTRAEAAGEEVRTGFERALGVALAIGTLPLPAAAECPNEGWSAVTPEQPPPYRADYPFVLRIEPRTCINGQPVRRQPAP
jgi:hypothetical protein